MQQPRRDEYSCDQGQLSPLWPHALFHSKQPYFAMDSRSRTAALHRLTRKQLIVSMDEYGIECVLRIVTAVADVHVPATVNTVSCADHFATGGFRRSTR